MSMLPAKVDELRELATRYDELQVGAVKTVKMPPNMGSILREAADTIWELRDDLQRANDAVRDAEHDESRAWDRVRKAEAEADKLREEIEAAKHDLQVFSMGSVQLEAENAKLRELVSDMMRAWWACDNEVCPRHDERCEKGKYCAFDECAQELGIEVDA